MNARSLLTALLVCFSFTIASAGEWQDLISKTGLDDWKKVGGDATYRLEDGVIVGKTGAGKNTFLTKGPFANFELEFEVKCDKPLNSGVQFRSHLYEEETPQESNPKRKREKGEMYGYQCEIRADLREPNGCAGNVWDEGRRTRWMDPSVDAKAAQKHYKSDGWNQFRIVAKGDRMQTYVNGKKVADFKDDRDASGLIGLQVHSIKSGTGPFEVRWRKIRIRELD